MNIFEEFWYGNIEPAVYDASPSKKMLPLISRNEDNPLYLAITPRFFVTGALFVRNGDCYIAETRIFIIMQRNPLRPMQGIPWFLFGE